MACGVSQLVESLPSVHKGLHLIPQRRIYLVQSQPEDEEAGLETGLETLLQNEIKETKNLVAGGEMSPR